MAVSKSAIEFNSAKRKQERENQKTKEAVRSVKDIPFLDGEFLASDIALGTSEKEVSHNLRRPIQGYLILSQDSPATIYRVPLVLPPPVDENERKGNEARFNSIIVLKASAAVNVKLWVF